MNYKGAYKQWTGEVVHFPFCLILNMPSNIKGKMTIPLLFINYNLRVLLTFLNYNNRGPVVPLEKNQSK